MSVESQVLSLLISKEWVSVADFEAIFPPGTEGHISWGQRKRDLHKTYKIEKRIKEGTKHTWEYHLVGKIAQLTTITPAGQLAYF